MSYMINEELVNKVKHDAATNTLFNKVKKASINEDPETYLSLKDLLHSELKNYSKEDFYDSLCYLANKTNKTKDDLER